MEVQGAFLRLLMTILGRFWHAYVLKTKDQIIFVGFKSFILVLSEKLIESLLMCVHTNNEGEYMGTFRITT